MLSLSLSIVQQTKINLVQTASKRDQHLISQKVILSCFARCFRSSIIELLKGCVSKFIGVLGISGADESGRYTVPLNTNLGTSAVLLLSKRTRNTITILKLILIHLKLMKNR